MARIKKIYISSLILITISNNIIAKDFETNSQLTNSTPFYEGVSRYTDSQITIPVSVLINNRIIDSETSLELPAKLQTNNNSPSSLKDAILLLNEIIEHGETVVNCDNYDSEVCKKYENLQASIDLTGGILKVYHTRENENNNYDTNGLLKINTSLSGSRSDGSNGIDYNSSRLAMAVDYGITDNNKVNIQFVSENDNYSTYNRIDKVTLDSLLNEDFRSSVYYSKRGNIIKQDIAESFVGFSFGSINENSDTSNATKIYETSSRRGMYEIYNDFGELEYSGKIDIGLNEILIRRSAVNSDFVTVNIIIDGEIVKSDKYYVGNNHSIKDANHYLSFGLINDHDNNISNPFTEYSFGYDKFNFDLGIAPTLDYSTFSARMGLRDFSTRISGTKQYDTVDIELGASSSFNLLDHYLGIYAYRRLKNDSIDSSNVTANISNSIRGLTYSISNSYSWNDDKSSVSNLISSNISKRYRFMDFDMNVALSASLNTTRKLKHYGLTFTFNLNDNFSTPQITLNNSNGNTNIGVSNNMLFDDGKLTLTPRYSQSTNGKNRSFGISADANYNHLKGDIFSEVSTERNYLGLNLRSNIYVAERKVFFDSSSFDAAVFIDHDGSLEDAVVIDGKRLTESNLVGISTNKDVDISSVKRDVKISDVSMINVKNFRYAKINISDNIFDGYVVYGRVIDGNENPLAGASIINHISESSSDKMGYFKLNVSKEHPEISIIYNNKRCSKINILNNSVEISGFYYMERTKCDV